VIEKKKLALAACALAFASLAAAQGGEQNFDPAQVKQGSAAYARHCAACHGPRMKDPEGSFDLRKFPRDQRERFVTSVTKGRKSMPPWGDLLKAEEIDALWAYVVAGEKN
jgi:mono/diheme cytochrome c family protein